MLCLQPEQISSSAKVALETVQFNSAVYSTAVILHCLMNSMQDFQAKH